VLIQSPKQKVDRLTSLLEALAPQAATCAPDDPAATLLLIGPEAPETLLLRLAPAGPAEVVAPDRIMAATRVAFAIPPDTVFGPASAGFDIALAGRPSLVALANILATETAGNRCGAEIARSLVASALLLMALRVVIDAEPPETGLLAGLADPRLHRAIVAMHEAPEARWSMDALAERAGLSRSRFMQVFAQVMGMTPGAYLQGWRLARARQALLAGRSVKQAASLAGFSSSAAFSRAFRRASGHAPSSLGP
jgi:AraC-like DNA-binding protein